MAKLTLAEKKMVKTIMTKYCLSRAFAINRIRHWGSRYGTAVNNILGLADQKD